MLNTDIKERILSSLSGSVLSTSMVSRKAGFSRITTAKYLHALAGKNVVQAVRVGKAVAWRVSEHKPQVAIIAKTGVGRIVKLSLGDAYRYVVSTSVHTVGDSFVIITDDRRIVKTASTPVILIGQYDADAWSLQDLFDGLTLRSLVKKVLQEQQMPNIEALASINVEHLDELEEALGVEAADELLTLLSRLLNENRLRHHQYGRSTFLLEQPINEHVIADVEQVFSVILSHVYGRMVNPGDRVIEEGISHIVPSLAIAVNAYLEPVNN